MNTRICSCDNNLKQYSVVGEYIRLLQVLHFHDTRIVNPDVRDELLQAIYKLLQSAVRLGVSQLLWTLSPCQFVVCIIGLEASCA